MATYAVYPNSVGASDGTEDFRFFRDTILGRSWYAVIPEPFDYTVRWLGHTGFTTSRHKIAIPARDAIRLMQVDFPTEFAKAMHSAISYWGIVSGRYGSTPKDYRHEERELVKRTVTRRNSSALVVTALAVGILPKKIPALDLVEVLSLVNRMPMGQEMHDWVFDQKLGDILLAIHHDPRRLIYFQHGLRDFDEIDRAIEMEIDPELYGAIAA